MQYYRVRQDDEMPFYSRPAGTGTGWPMVFRMEPYKGTKMYAALQWFWFRLNLTADTGKNIQAWNAYTKSGVAFNNGSWGVNVCRNYITSERLGVLSPYPQMGRLICGGNVITGIEMTLTKRQGALLKGTKVLKVSTIDVRKPLPAGISYKTHPHLIHHATIIRPEREANGLKRVNPFPQLYGRDGVPIYYPVWSDGDVYYPLRQLEKLPLNSPIPNPYNPAWSFA